MSNSEWISVKDRLPSEVCTVIAAKNNGKVAIMSYHAAFNSEKRLFQWWSFGTWINQHSQVTHWMPLPEPPKNNQQ